MGKTDKHYVSDIDKKLAEFDAVNPKSASQLAEIAKYKRLNRKRDKKIIPPARHRKLWEDF